MKPITPKRQDIAEKTCEVWAKLLGLLAGRGYHVQLSPLGDHHLACAERRFGQAFPPDLHATYRVLHGCWIAQVPGFYHLEALGEAVRQWQVDTAIACELRPADKTGRQDDTTLRADQQIRHDGWNRGWFPIGQFNKTSTLCVDMAPGPAGVPGQLIAVSLGAAHQPLEPGNYRVVSSCLLEYITRLADAVDALSKDRGGMWRVTATGEPLDITWLHGRPSSWRAEWAPRFDPHASLPALPPPPSFQQPGPAFDLQPLLLQACPELDESFEHDQRPADFLDGVGAHDDLLSRCAAWTRQSDVPPFWLLMGAPESGKTTLLHQLAQRLVEAHDGPGPVQVPVVIDLSAHAGATSLLELLDAHLQGLGVADKAESLLRAVHQGECMLLLDNAQALLEAGHDVWTWCRNVLPAESLDLALKRGARILVTIDEEWLEANGGVTHAVLQLTPAWDFRRLSVQVTRFEGH